uniref:Uncharacterized protein n=1 Tax=Tanacetum cinerariifolium TaxID=118510 RepID=A0A699I0S3_TANCI|nr:hypothetical protein [Tanacetum cinerariifolium]
MVVDSNAPVQDKALDVLIAVTSPRGLLNQGSLRIVVFMWQDEHNSCPVCRHELRTNDDEYKCRKEHKRGKELLIQLVKLLEFGYVEDK